MRRAVRMMRSAISPRLAIRILKNGVRLMESFMAARPRIACACGARASDSRQIANTSASTLRVSRGSITPSSSTRALVENTSIWPSNTPVISAFIASSFSFGIGLPRRAAALR